MATPVYFISHAYPHPKRLCVAHLHMYPHNVFSLEISCIYYTPNLGNNMSNCVYTVKDPQFKQRSYQVKH